MNRGVPTDLYSVTKQKPPDPLETVGWGILIYLTSEIISVLFRFP